MISSLPIDTYQNKLPAYRGFYLQVNTFIALHNNNVFSESNNKTIISLEQTQEGKTERNSSDYSFYYESMSNAPEIDSFDISFNTTNLFQVSGIWVLYGISKLNATTVISNIGKSFYNKNKILSYHSRNNEIGSETDLTNITQNSRTDIKLNPQVIIMNIGKIDFSNNDFSKEISLTSVAYNPLDLSNTSLPSNILTIYDQPSYNLITNPTLYPTSVQTVGNGTKSNLSDITGFRVWSDNTSGNVPANVTSLPSTIRYIDISYNHSWDLTSQNNDGYDATQELQIFNGAYGSKGTSQLNRNGYLDYTIYNKSSSEQNVLDYSSITNTNIDYRFATFCWKCNENLSNYTKIAFVMKGITQTIDNPNKKPSVSGKPIYVYYRLEDNDNPDKFSAAYKNTLWIDANSSTNAITASNYYKVNLTDYVSGILLGGNNTDSRFTNTFINGELTINVLIPSLSISNNSNIYIYLRVGLPMSVDINFTHVTCSLV